MADVRIFLTTTGAGTWTVPEDWNSEDNTIECIGGGGIGYATNNGGGGGGYSSISNLSLTPGASVAYSVGVGAAYDIGVGGDTWFGNSVYASANVAAKGGGRPTGGQSSLGIGTTKYSGGDGSSEGPGGGAAGPNGNGNNATVSVGGSGDAGFGGAGGTSSPATPGLKGTEWDANHGSGGGGGGNSKSGFNNGGGGLYGGGAGLDGNAAPGANGIIVITYTPVASGSSKFFQLFN